MISPTYNPQSQTIRAKCSYCEGAFSVFQLHAQSLITIAANTIIPDIPGTFTAVCYGIFRCPGCTRCALGTILHRGSHADPAPGQTYLESFYPFSAAALPLPP